MRYKKLVAIWADDPAELEDAAVAAVIAAREGFQVQAFGIHLDDHSVDKPYDDPHWAPSVDEVLDEEEPILGDPENIILTPTDTKRCVRVEYDLAYAGGNYSGVGEYAYIPWEEIDTHGNGEGALRLAFRAVTGHDPIHIVHYTFDEVYDQRGNPLEN